MERRKILLESDPLWYKDAIIYEVHIRSFYDSNGDGIGDLQGLIQKLDYLQDLGINCIWLLPFYPSPLKDDGYDISNYRDVHPAYGTLKDFRELVREAHQRSIRIITELVINHTSDQHAWFQAARKAPAGSAKRNYYVWSKTSEKYKDARIIFKDTEKSNWTWDPDAKSYYWHRFFSHQPDLNFDNPHVRRAILRVMRFWLDMGVDGMRLDAVPYLIERDGTNCENLPETHAILKEMRKELDKHYKDRMFLAEANQWPVDVRPYFGDGDECHMAFHFPLMPRIFMALRQEDRHPITDILRQTPEIPATCQWAIFLRNHDELTLEMVTNAERDYMYNEYATEPLMRLNLGIRRRLAPLLNNSRRRLELLISLLFSFPGTPVLYYGDEIAMGDNFYLGDRNGVRTPMQWSSDRNAGFSKADFAKLYAPPIMDSVYGYQALNVEAQQRDPSSFLNWTKRMIALSKRFKTFGRGKMEFLSLANRKILAYVRRYGDETFLAVANLSRFVQPAELNLSEFKGCTPVEMLGSVEFPKIGELPYFLTLGPHSFYWFQLQHVTTALSAESVVVAPRMEAEGLPEMVLAKASDLPSAASQKFLEEEVLPSYIPTQRWFGAKADKVEKVRIVDWILVTENPVGYLCVIEVNLGSGRTERFVLTLSLGAGHIVEDMKRQYPEAVLCSVRLPQGVQILFDGMRDETFNRALLALSDRAKIVKGKGRIEAIQAPDYGMLREAAGTDPVVARTSGEQSNSSVRYGKELILKVYRHLEPGPNADYEMSRALSEKLSFGRVPKTLGALEYQRAGTPPATLAMIQQQVKNQGDGWSHTLDEMARYFDRVSGKPVTASDHASAALAKELMGSYLYSAGVLGRRTAEMHRALAESSTDPAFSPEPLTPEHVSQQRVNLREYAKSVFDVLDRKAAQLPETLLPSIQKILSLKPTLFSETEGRFLETVQAGRTRIHGDYHLGQVLWADNDFYIIDFEGEPARTLAERRAKQSPLKDVAGMLRSFHYAAYAGLYKAAADRPADVQRLEPAAQFWNSWTVTTFLKEYRQVAGDSFLPKKDVDFKALLDLFLLDKMLYEILYELNNRPAWVGIPIKGLLAALDPTPTDVPL